MRKEEDGTKHYRKSLGTRTQSRRAPVTQQFHCRLGGKRPRRKALPPTREAAVSLAPLYTAEAPNWLLSRDSSMDAAR